MTSRKHLSIGTAMFVACAAAPADVLLDEHQDVFGQTSPLDLIGATVVWAFDGESCTAPTPYVFWEGLTFTPDDAGRTFDILPEDIGEFPAVAEMLTNGEADFMCHHDASVAADGALEGSYHGFAELAHFSESPWINGWDFQGSVVTDLQLRIDDLSIGPDPDKPGNTLLRMTHTLLIWGSPPEIQQGDSNLDGRVDVTDLLAVLKSWGECRRCPEDSDADQMVNVTDLINVLMNWG